MAWPGIAQVIRLAAPPAFRAFAVNADDAAANRVNVVYRARDRIWAGTDAGLYRL